MVILLDKLSCKFWKEWGHTGSCLCIPKKLLLRAIELEIKWGGELLVRWQLLDRDNAISRTRSLHQAGPAVWACRRWSQHSKAAIFLRLPATTSGLTVGGQQSILGDANCGLGFAVVAQFPLELGQECSAPGCALQAHGALPCMAKVVLDPSNWGSCHLGGGVLPSAGGTGWTSKAFAWHVASLNV